MIIETVHFDLRDYDVGKVSIPNWMNTLIRNAANESAKRGSTVNLLEDIQRYCDENHFDVQCRSSVIYSRRTYDDDSRTSPVEEVWLLNFAWDDEAAKAAFLLQVS
jgi:hypothetical protein